MNELLKRFFLWYHALIATAQALTFMDWQLICSQSMRNYLPTYITKDKVIFLKHPLATQMYYMWDITFRGFFFEANWDVQNKTFITTQEFTIKNIKRDKS